MALLFADIGPFSTVADLLFWERRVSWMIIKAGVGFLMPVLSMVALQSPYLALFGVARRLILTGIVAGLPGAAVVFLLDLVFRKATIDGTGQPVPWLQVSAIGIPLSILEFARAAACHGATALDDGWCNACRAGAFA